MDINTKAKLGKVISFANQKGGVGKTTSAVNVAASLGLLGHKTLVIDLDPQGNATSGLGISKKGLKNTAYEILMGKISAKEAIIDTGFEKLYLIPATMTLANTDYNLFGEEGMGNIMKEALAPIKEEFDYIIIDCPPSLNTLTINALIASDGVVIPLQCEFYAMEGLSQLSQTISRIKKNYNSTLNITGIIITMYNNRLLLSQQVLAQLRKIYADRIFSTQISRGVKLSEAPSYGKPIYYHDKRSKGSAEYLSVAAELATRI